MLEQVAMAKFEFVLSVLWLQGPQRLAICDLDMLRISKQCLACVWLLSAQQYKYACSCQVTVCDNNKKCYHLSNLALTSGHIQKSFYFKFSKDSHMNV